MYQETAKHTEFIFSHPVGRFTCRESVLCLTWPSRLSTGLFNVSVTHNELIARPAGRPCLLSFSTEDALSSWRTSYASFRKSGNVLPKSRQGLQRLDRRLPSLARTRDVSHSRTPESWSCCSVRHLCAEQAESGWKFVSDTRGRLGAFERRNARTTSSRNFRDDFRRSGITAFANHRHSDDNRNTKESDMRGNVRIPHSFLPGQATLFRSLRICRQVGLSFGCPFSEELC